MATIRLFKPTDLVGFGAETILEHNDWSWGSVAITRTGIRLDYDTATDGGIAALRVSQSARISFEIADLGSHHPAPGSWNSYWTGNLQPLVGGMLGGNDLVIGSSGGDRIMAHGGDDRLHTGSGDDWLGGGQGNDVLSAGAGNDALSGGDGADRLLGGAGNDNLHGGAGADRFQFFAGNGVDLIADFQDGVDKIDFFSGATRFEDLRLVQSGANTLIHYGDSRIIVGNTDIGDLDRSDFWFA